MRNLFNFEPNKYDRMCQFKYFFLLQFCLFFGHKSLFAQEKIHPDSTEIAQEDLPILRKQFHTGFSLNSVIFRDFATSPLFYSGMGIAAHLGVQKDHNRWTYQWQTALRWANTTAKIPASTYYQSASGATFLQGDLRYSYLRKMKTLQSPYQLLLGAALHNNFNIRLNPQLQNAAFGLEAFINLLFAAQVSKSFSRSEDKIYNLGLFTYRAKAQQSALSFRLDLGLVNLNYRPGYAYLSDSEVNGTNIGLSYVFDAHQWKLNGARMETTLAYQRQQNSNQNGAKWAYHWEIIHAPGAFESFQMAIHQFSYTLLIHRKYKNKK